MNYMLKSGHTLKVKLLTTKCCIDEMEKLGPPVFGALMILKQAWKE